MDKLEQTPSNTMVNRLSNLLDDLTDAFSHEKSEHENFPGFFEHTYQFIIRFDKEALQDTIDQADDSAFAVMFISEWDLDCYEIYSSVRFIMDENKLLAVPSIPKGRAYVCSEVLCEPIVNMVNNLVNKINET